MVQTVTDRDGDSAAATIDVGAGNAFRIEDDGPKATVNGALAVPALVLDESALPAAGDGVRTATAQFATNFDNAVGIYGTDGAGSVAYTLKLTGNNVGSGLFALDAADTTAGDGDGIGKGAEIVLNQAGNVVTGSVGGTDYFTISINNATGAVTFSQTSNIWQGNTGSADESETLKTAVANALQVVQTVTDRDGDTASATIDVGAGNAFRIEDDGPMAQSDTNLVAATAGATTTGNVITGVSSAGVGGADAIGTDGGGTIASIRSDNGAGAQGTVGQSLAGQYGNLVINANGSYTYTRTAATTITGEDKFTYVLKDADGDASPANLVFTIDTLGVAGGHFDVDTYNDTGRTGYGNSDGHIHEYDNKYGLRNIDAFNMAGSSLQNITANILDTSTQVFRLMAINGARNAGVNIEINGVTYDAFNYGVDGKGENMQLYTLNAAVAAANSNVQLLTSLDISFPADAITTGGLRGTVTGDVKPNKISPDGEWRTGGFSMWAVEVKPDPVQVAGNGMLEVNDATDGYKLTKGDIHLDPNTVMTDVIKGITTETGGTFTQGHGILHEISAFWHWGAGSGADYTYLTPALWQRASGGDLPAGTPFPSSDPNQFVYDTAQFRGGAIGSDTGNDVITGWSSNDLILGMGGNDTINGGAGNDDLRGGAGNDIIVGGKGNDILTGGSGADTFKWNSGDQGTGAAPAADIIKDFNTTTTDDANKDVLDLRDLLVNENHTIGNGNLSSYLEFAQTKTVAVDGTNEVTLSVHSQGAPAVDQTIVLQNVTMAQLAGVPAGNPTSADVISHLLANKQLITD